MDSRVWSITLVCGRCCPQGCPSLDTKQGRESDITSSSTQWKPTETKKNSSGSNLCSQSGWETRQNTQSWSLGPTERIGWDQNPGDMKAGTGLVLMLLRVSLGELLKGLKEACDHPWVNFQPCSLLIMLHWACLVKLCGDSKLGRV